MQKKHTHTHKKKTQLTCCDVPEAGAQSVGPVVRHCLLEVERDLREIELQTTTNVKTLQLRVGRALGAVLLHKGVVVRAPPPYATHPFLARCLATKRPRAWALGVGI